MTIKDIIEKLEEDKSSNKVYMKTLVHNAAKYSYICGLLDWIKSNLEEGYEEYGNDRDDVKEIGIANNREG